MDCEQVCSECLSPQLESLKVALLTESEPSWEPVKQLDRKDMRNLLQELLAEGSQHLSSAELESSASFVNNFGRFCSVYVEAVGDGRVVELAEDLNQVVPEKRFSVSILIALLGGESGDNFSFDLLEDLLNGLDVDWEGYRHLGDVACSLLSWPACNSDASCIGRLFRSLVLPDTAGRVESFFPTEDVVEVICGVIDDGWEASLAGHIARVGSLRTCLLLIFFTAKYEYRESCIAPPAQSLHLLKVPAVWHAELSKMAPSLPFCLPVGC
uniref:Uncharacterized protein n=1 Tax=Tetraselmis sp. GSL018 TaxID=582737 RepID=A0A061SB82_9CHLO|eukprot:CAMPEP_0177590992 /NCGR_PEP_ID=MMETSP0419_2-20121207/7735_1 /TAXON_ID=582737 /ORGANISM="Tetraselmis sp., Strain GSL018" /LENGTH=268 /DNA_ID=CAMNT_0019081655 /DNA_START=220 /DNA_END=1026 /DNA_ORIENTATION=-